ncbi:TonB-dependent receptor [Telluria mixta]|uniref:TonB-dependent receptor n=1 Tax=Telluria mixta TaxID=34071 RepID=A0ABT2BZC6_9BURK|nr:TonB-dependent receptor [Telluria mixta]MCS0629941.1 TonB-dependent receptor [Telluria mixta]WEM96506.1 TonB-dependent receptor [Telluria mixta]
MKTKRPSHFLPSMALVGALLCGAGAQAQVRNFDIAPGELKTALDAYAAQSGTQLLYKMEDVKGRSTQGVKRALSPDDALRQLLDGTPLSVRRDVSGALVIFAAPAPPPPPSDKRSEVEQVTPGMVVVTATRRREPAREVPMQVSSLSTERLTQAGARGLQDYLGSEAGVDVKSTGGPGIGTLTIRGVSTGTQTISTVGVYIDDVAFGSSTAAANGAQMALDMALLDLNHIELLRGPQGTLYGASAMGGLLKYVTNEPDTTEFSGKAMVSASTTRHGGAGHMVSAVVNAPLKEDVAGLRVSAFTDHAGGSVDSVDLRPGRDIDGGRTSGRRVSLLLMPAHRLRVRLTGTTQRIARGGTDFVDYDASDGRPVRGTPTRQLFGAEPYRVKTDVLAAEVEYDFGWARLNSITSRQRVRSSAGTDFSFGYVPLLRDAGIDVDSTVAVVDVSLDKTTQEVRLTSKADKQLEWLAGVYLNRENSNNRQRIDTTSSGLPGASPLAVAIPAEYREAALFGDVTWKFSRALAVTAGLRTARNRQHYVQQSDGPLAGGSQALEARSSDSTRTWLLTARYNLTPGSSIYARAATGYRPGGPNAVLRDPATGAPTGPTSFQPDTLTSYELGYKADLLDKRLHVETAVFDLEWKNLQQYRPVNGIATIVNAGAARVRGAELTAIYRPDDRWTLAGNAAWIDAKLTKDAPGLDAVAGARLPSSARFSASLSANYTFEVAGFAAYAGATQRYVGARNAGFAGSAALPFYRLPAYALTDLQAGVDFRRASVSLFVRNVFDRRAQLAADSTVQAFGGPAWVSLAQARTIGATLTVPF